MQLTRRMPVPRATGAVDPVKSPVRAADARNVTSVVPAHGRPRSGVQHGFTIVELLVAISIAGVLMALAVPSFSRYQNNHDFVASARQTVAELRLAQAGAVAEETSYRVDFTVGGRVVKLYRFDGTSFQLVKTTTLPGKSAVLGSPVFRKRDGTSSTSAYFYARGTASDGQVEVQKSGTSKKYVVQVEGLTGRVTYS